MKLRTEYGVFGALWLLLAVILLLNLSDKFPALLLVRLVCGLIAVAYMPGYFLLTILFPTRHHLNDLERLAVSVGLSLALIPAEALILDKLSLGFHLEVVAATAGIVTAILAVISLVCRLAIPQSERYALFDHLPDLPRASWHVDGRTRIVVILGALVVVALIVGATNLLLPKPSAQLTEFSILDTQGSTANYPKQVAVGDNINTSFVIANQEGSEQVYRVEIWENNQRLKASDPMDVPNGEQTKGSVPFQLNQAGDNQEIFFNLYRMNDTSPYRTLHLWFDVTGSSS